MPDLPPVKPSAIALGTIFNHAASLAVMAPLFGDTYQRAQSANSKEEFFKSKEAATAAATWGSSLVGSAVQSYGVGALINATGTLSYKGAAYLGSLIFFASSAPAVCIPLSTLENITINISLDRLPTRHREATTRYRRRRRRCPCFRNRRSQLVPYLLGNPYKPIRLSVSLGRIEVDDLNFQQIRR